MKEAASPEEKLLRLIKQDTKAPALKEAGFPLASRTKASAARRNYLTILTVKNIIKVLAFLAFVYMSFNFIYAFFAPKNIVLPKEPSLSPDSGQAIEKEEPRPLDFYLGQGASRQIFSNSQAQKDEGLGAQAQIAEESLKDLNLVGVLLSETPQAMIEDKKLQKTYSVSTGQFIGDYKVEEIREGKVVLSRGGQRYEIGM